MKLDSFLWKYEWYKRMVHSIRFRRYNNGDEVHNVAGHVVERKNTGSMQCVSGRYIWRLK